MDYEKDVEIQHDALDVEWLGQPQLMRRYTKHAADKKAEMDRAKELVDFTKAELDKEIRLEPEKFGITKITESVVLNTILMCKIYKNVMEDYIECRYEHQVAQGVVTAIDHKKTALESLVKLHGQQYFAGPSVPRDLSKEWEAREKQKASNEKVKRMTRTRKE